MSDRNTGIVKWFNNRKGYGFIERSEGPDVFVHYRSIQSDGYRSLVQGQEVEFTLTTGEKGPHAEEVTVTAEQTEQSEQTEQTEQSE